MHAQRPQEPRVSARRQALASSQRAAEPADARRHELHAPIHLARDELQHVPLAHAFPSVNAARSCSDQIRGFLIRREPLDWYAISASATSHGLSSLIRTISSVSICAADLYGDMSPSMRASVSRMPFSISARSAGSLVRISNSSSSFVLKAAIASVRPSITLWRVIGVESCTTGSYGKPAIA